MADFHQPETVATLHCLRRDRLAEITETLETRRPAGIGLVLPALVTEFDHPAMSRIIDELARARFLSRIVVALGGASAQQYADVRRRLARVRTPVDVLQVDHPETRALLADVERQGLPTGTAGKGRTCWLALGHLLGRGDCDVVVFHDADIRDYSRHLLAALAFPIAMPELGLSFAKGFYARANGQLYGRVTRLLVTPLVRALERCGASSPFLRFLADLRYPLSGEMAMRTSLAELLALPTDWGLEIGLLEQAYRRCLPGQTCQVEIADLYEHRHKPLAPGAAGSGLRKMAVEVSAAIFRSLRGDQVSVGGEQAGEIRARYREAARTLMARYRVDALFNGLRFDDDEERLAVSTFAEALGPAIGQAQQPTGATLLAPWHLVREAAPSIHERMRTLVNRTDTLRSPRVPVLVSGAASVARLLTTLPTLPSRQAGPSEGFA